MPSLRTRTHYDRIVLATAEDAIADASASLAAATVVIDGAVAGVGAATADLEALALGTYDLTALTINGQRFINNAGVLEAEV